MTDSFSSPLSQIIKLFGADFSEGSNWAKRCAAAQFASLLKLRGISCNSVKLLEGHGKSYDLALSHIFHKMVDPACNNET